MNKLTIDDIDVRGKRVLVRVDFNVPLDEKQNITDDTRIVESLPTIKKILASGGSAILMSHLGRPKGKPKLEFSLMPVALRLEKLLGKKVLFASDCIGEPAESTVAKLKSGDCLLLENLRYHNEEEANDPAFAKSLAKLGDVYAHFAIANMTGANRLLIGIGWPVIVFIAWTKMRKPIRLEAERATELVFLLLATIWGFVVFFKNSLMWYDAIIFISFFIGYMIIASKRPCEEVSLEGPSKYIGSCRTMPRRFWTWLMFAFAAAVIIVNAEPFSEGLVGTGEVFGISKFLLVQWLAPLASEAPEFIVAILLALRGSPSMALGALVSSKLNQWSLLVGMIPGAYALSSGQMSLPIPMDHHQMLEILLTAAQSILAIALLSDFRLSFKEALLLVVLFLGQFVLSPWFDSMHASGTVAWDGSHIRIAFTFIYVIFAAYNFIRYPLRLKKLLQGFKVAPDFCDLSLGEIDDKNDKNGVGKS